MRKSLMIALITIMVVFTIRMLYQAIKIKEQMPQLEKISEARKYAKEVEEMDKSFIEDLQKRGIISNHGPQLPPGVVEITFVEGLPPSPQIPYAGSYEIYLEKGEKILEGNSPIDGKILTPKLNPGIYLIRVPGTPLNVPFTIYESDTRGKGVRVAIHKRSTP